MGKNRNTYRLLVGKPEGKSHLEDQDVGGWIILGWIFQFGWGYVDWIDLAQDRNRWRALVNSVLNLRAS
jgi:hypothetical protein